MTENERTFVPRQKFYVALPYNITIVIRWVSQNTITPTRVIALSLHLHGVNLSPPTHTTRATNSSHSTITQRTLKKASDLIYVEDTRSTRVFPGLHGIEPLSGIEVYTMDTDFSTWLTIEDTDMDILEICHTRPPHSHTFLNIIGATSLRPPTCLNNYIPTRQFIYRVSINCFPDYKHLLQENYVEYKHFFFKM